MGLDLQKTLKRESNRGFTLLEIVLVLGMVGLLFSLFAPQVFRKKPVKPCETLRSLTVLSKKLHQEARSSGLIHRMAFLPVSDKDSDSYQFAAEVESSAGKFELADKLTKDPVALSKQLKLVSFESEAAQGSGNKDPRHYVHYYPQGLAERTVIQFETDRKIKWSLIIEPLTGRADLKQEFVKLKDLTD